MAEPDWVYGNATPAQKFFPPNIEDVTLPKDYEGEADRVRNAYYYSRNIGLTAEDAYDYEPQINEALFGTGTSSASAWGKLHQANGKARRKNVIQAITSGAKNAQLQTAATVTGLALMGEEFRGAAGSTPAGPFVDLAMRIVDPAMRWMLHVPKDVDMPTFLAGLSKAAQQDIQDAQKAHPELGYAIDPDATYSEALWQVFSRPENIVQGMVESSGLIMDGLLGTAAAGPAGAVVAMSIPIAGQVYGQARTEGTEPLPAFAQAWLTGGIEAMIEEWTLGRKIGLAKNFRRMISDRPFRRVLWEGTKAFFRGSTEESTQQVNQNFWNWVFTDRSQKMLEGVGQATALGGPLEMFTAGAFAGANYLGTPVDVREARHRIDTMRKAVRDSKDLSKDQKDELLTEIDKAVGIVPETLIDESALSPDGKERAQTFYTEAEAESFAEDLSRYSRENNINSTVERKGRDVRWRMVEQEAQPSAETPKAKAAPTEAPVAQSSEPAQEMETTEEAQAAEARLEAEGAEEVVPNLYIGNLTARAKRAWSEGFTWGRVSDETRSVVERLSTGEPISIEEAQRASEELQKRGIMVSPEEIRGHLEGAWKTKRTNIPMSRAEAEEYLGWLEADLRRRVDENLITTDPQIAQAHADYGDIKELRRVLGMEAVAEPFRVVYAAKQQEAILDKKEIEALKKDNARILKKLAELTTADEGKIEVLEQQQETTKRNLTVLKDLAQARKLTKAEARRRSALQKEYDARQSKIDERVDLENKYIAQKKQIAAYQKTKAGAKMVIPNVRSAIYSAVQPSTMEPANVTRQDLLRAVMQRGARESKMAYAAGRRELRSSMRAARQLRQRWSNAAKRIRQRVPANVDVSFQQAIRDLREAVDLRRRRGTILQERRTLQRLLKRYPKELEGAPEQFKSLFRKPVEDLTLADVEDIANQIDNLIALGQVELAQRQTKYEQSKKEDLAKATAGAVKAADVELVRPNKIGEPLTAEQKARNLFATLWDKAVRAKNSVAQPMDVLFDRIDGGKNYKGPNFKLFKEGLDTKHNDYLDYRDSLWKPLERLARELGLPQGSMERIGVYATKVQENGNQKLLDTGYSQDEIDEVVLTPQEMQWYDLARQTFDELRGPIAEVMHTVYNAPLGQEKNYFSFQTDFDAMSKFEVRELYGDNVQENSLAPRKNVEKGFTKERTGGKQKIRVNAFEVARRHIENATYLVEMASEIKRLYEIANSKEYGAAVGKAMQEEVLSYLDLMARKGGTERNMVIPFLDTLRKHTGAAMIGFKLSTALVNASPLLDGAGMIGPYAFTGAHKIATNRSWREFIYKNMPEIRDRMGGEADFFEFGSTKLELVERAGFWPLQQIDGLMAASIAQGAYQKYLDEHGLQADYDKPNKQGLLYAQLIVRRTQASAFFKDLPSAFTRGTLTGNKSLDRLFLQFQTFMMNRWSYIEHDMIAGGIRGNTQQMANIFFFLTMAVLSEISLRRFSKELVALLTGEETDAWSETFQKELAINSLQNIPFISQGVSFYNYGQVPVPSVSLVQDIGDRIVRLKRTKDVDKRRWQMLELILVATGTLAGVPGTSQVGQLTRSAAKANTKSTGSTNIFGR
jgi:predicted transcriptional regulator